MVALKELPPALHGATRTAAKAKTHFARASSLFEQGLLLAAAEEYSVALDVVPRDVALLNNRGTAYAWLGMLDQALRDFEEALSIDPNDGVLWMNRGLTLIKAGRVDEALGNFARALETGAVDRFAVLMNRGIALVEAGQQEDGLADFLEASALQPERPEPVYNAAVALLALGRHKDAVAEIDKVLLLRPDVTDAAKLRRDILDSQLRRLVRRGLISWSGGKPSFPKERVELTPGAPISQWIIENRR